MSDPTGAAPLDVRPAKKGLLSRLSIIWLVPLLALAVSLAVAWQSYANRGTLIEIVFENASGISADETVIKYRDVDVGRVEDVTFSDGLDVVIVKARIDQGVVPYLDDDAQFWVVRPDVSVRGISGLDTVLSGVYIEGSWDTEPDVAQLNFVGLESPPLTRASQRGTAIVLRARDGSALATGAPILHKGIEVGYLESPELSSDGQSVTVNAFIEAPFDRRVTTNTRFWDTSGFSISLGAGGVSLDVDSLASLIEGGIAFDTVVSGGSPIRDGQVFNLFEDAETARESLFDDGPSGELLNISVLFDGSVNGLSVGSDVRFQGIVVGEVIDLAAVVVDDRNTTRVQLRAVLGIDPSRLGMSENETPEYALDFLTNFVRQGLRARLTTGNILSGSLVVQLVELPDAPLAVMDLDAEPYPTLPSAPSAITDVADTADDVLQRINDLPIEELLSSAINLMNTIELFAAQDSLQAAPDSLIALMEDARGLIASDDIQAIAPEVRALLGDIDSLLAQIQDRDLIGSLSGAVESAQSAANRIEESTTNLPQIVEGVETLVATANALNLNDLINEANGAVEAINGFVSSDALNNLPTNLQSVLDQTQLAITDVQTLITADDTAAIPASTRMLLDDLGGLVTQARDADVVGQLSTAIDSAALAATNIDAATQNLPAIIAEVEALAETANRLELETLVTRASDTLASIETLIGSDSTQALPDSMGAALDEMRLFLAEVREGGAITNVNAALASANSAARAIEDAAESLPALSRQAAALVRETESVLETYNDRSRFNSETLTTLRDIQDAADAVSSLARTIQRNPNSLLTGR